MRHSAYIMGIISLLIILTMLAIPSNGFGEVPHQINYQGYLTDDLGNPLDGEYWFLFSIYDVSTGGTALWQENPQIRMTKGVYNVHLGLDPTGNPFPDGLFNGQLWLGVAVESDAEMEPRQLLTSTPFAKRAAVADSVQDGVIETIHLANDAVTSDKIDVGAVTSSHIQDGATIIEILDDDGEHSGLDADLLDGREASEFLSPGSDHGRYSITSNLYEGTTALTNKYVNQNGDDMTGRLGVTVTPFGSDWTEAIKGSLLGGDAGSGVFGYTTGTSTYGVYGVATGNEGVGVYGEANATDQPLYITNYGGKFIATGASSYGVYAESNTIGSPFTVSVGGKFITSGKGGTGVIGNATALDDGIFNRGIGGSFTSSSINGRGVSGHASNNGDNKNYGGHFTAYGTNGRGVLGQTSGTAGVGVFGDAVYRGLEGHASGTVGVGVYGYASNPGDVTNWGGYFEAEGINGRGVHGFAIGSYGIGVYASAWGIYGRAFEGIAYGTTGTNHGGYFEARGPTGRGVYGRATGSSGTGVRASGEAYDFIAVGPGTNYGSESSIRWKQNIQEIDGALEMVMQMRGVYFDWDEGHGGKHDLGFIAEEVGQYVPEIVVYEEETEYASGMDYSMMTPILLQAIKEQQGIIAELRSEMEVLKEEIAAIKAGL